MRKIFVDLDGVLADFHSAVCKRYELVCTPDELISWTGVLDAFKRKTGKKSSAFWAGLDLFFWQELEKTPECDQILSLVEPFKPVILTAPPVMYPYTQEAVSGKTWWIMRHLREYFHDGRFLIGPAKEYCAGPGAILIDDSEQNCVNWEIEGGKAVLVPRSWNTNRDLPVVESVRAQLRYILIEENE